MECTQALENTQADPDHEEVKEQVGILGILGRSYPLNLGSNKIGRDPVCEICLNDNTLSRQHAVFILNKNEEYFLMDMGSRNKTKIRNTILKPYSLNRLQNGDTVEFGTAIGVFKLFSQNTDLPETQAFEDNNDSTVDKEQLSTVICDESDLSIQKFECKSDKQVAICESPERDEDDALELSQEIVNLNDLKNSLYRHKNTENKDNSNQSVESKNDSIFDDFKTPEPPKNLKCIKKDNTTTTQSIYDAETQVFNDNDGYKPNNKNNYTDQCNEDTPFDEALTQVITDPDDLANAETQCFAVKNKSLTSENNIHELKTQIGETAINDANTQLFFGDGKLAHNLGIETVESVSKPNVSDYQKSEEIGTQKIELEEIAFAETQILCPNPTANNCEESKNCKKIYNRESDEEISLCDINDDHTENDFDIMPTQKLDDFDMESKHDQIFKNPIGDGITQKPSDNHKSLANDKSDDFNDDILTQVIMNVQTKPEQEQIPNENLNSTHLSEEKEEDLMETQVIGEYSSMTSNVNTLQDDNFKIPVFTDKLRKSGSFPSPSKIAMDKNKDATQESKSVDSSPIKMRPFFMDVDLPNSQDIAESSITRTPPESDVDDLYLTNDDSENSQSQDSGPPIVFKVKEKKKVEVDRSIEALVDRRFSMRQRKLNFKLRDGDDKQTNKLASLLKPNIVLPQDENFDINIIHENLRRIKEVNKKQQKNKEKKEITRKDDEKTVIEKRKETFVNKVEDSLAKENINKPKRGRPKKSSESIKKNSVTETVTSTSDVTNSSKNRGGKPRHSQETASSDNSGRSKHNAKNIPTSTATCTEDNKHENVKQTRLRSRHHTEPTAPNKSESQTRSVTRKSDPSHKCQQLKRSRKEDDSGTERKKGKYEKPTTSEQKKENDITHIGTSSRRSQTKRRVLFTSFPDKKAKDMLERLGVVIESDVTKCTVIVTTQIRRTFKLLCGIGLGKPVVGPNWIQACIDTQMIVDPWKYLLRDPKGEKKYSFDLRQTLLGPRNCLKGFNISSTPNVRPNQDELKEIVKCSGGNWKEGGRRWYCVSCLQDQALWPDLEEKGATIVGNEFVLGNVLRQKVSIEMPTT